MQLNSRFPILFIVLFFLCGKNFSQHLTTGKWVGEIDENGSRYTYTLFIEKINGKYIEGRSLSTNSSFTCSAFVNGEIEGNRIKIIEKYVIATNYPQKEDVCLMSIEFVSMRESLTGKFISSNRVKKKCGNGTVNLRFVALPTTRTDTVAHFNPAPVLLAKKNQPESVSAVYNDTAGKKSESTTKPVHISQLSVTQGNQQIRRKIDLTHTIVVPNDSVHIAVFDNGIIDGDEITLIVNGRVFIRNQKLSDKPIVFTLKREKNTEFVVEFFANNLGSIPPNTGLITIKNNAFYRELTFSSDLIKTNAVKIVFETNLP